MDILSQAAALKNGLAADEAEKRLRQSFLMETNNADTHPSLKDRLRAIGRLPANFDAKDFTITPPPAPSQSAAEVLLGSHAETLARQLSEEWRTAVSAQWAARHEHAQKLAEELTHLEQPGDAPPTAEELWEKAAKIIQLHSDAEALPVIEQLLATSPTHPTGNFVLGRIQLEAEDVNGVALIEQAMDADPELTEDGCNLLYAFYNRHGQRDKIKDLERRMDKFQEISALAQRERSQVNAANTFIPHELLEAQLESLRQIFAAEKEIGSVAVARKQVEHFKKNPCYVIGLDIKVPWWKPRSSSANGKLVNRVLKQVKLPGYFLVFVNEKNLKGLWTKISYVPGATVYMRSSGLPKL